MREQKPRIRKLKGSCMWECRTDYFMYDYGRSPWHAYERWKENRPRSIFPIVFGSVVFTLMALIFIGLALR